MQIEHEKIEGKEKINLIKETIKKDKAMYYYLDTDDLRQEELTRANFE